jgi:hypothetical protein
LSAWSFNRLLAAEGCSLVEGPTLLRYAFDKRRGLWTASSALSYTRWEARIPSSRRWEGVGFVYRSPALGTLTVEILCPEPAPSSPITALLGEPAKAVGLQSRRQKEGTAWARLLLALYAELGAVRCVFDEGLRDLDLGRLREPWPAKSLPLMAILARDDSLLTELKRRGLPRAVRRARMARIAADLLTRMPVRFAK